MLFPRLAGTLVVLGALAGCATTTHMPMSGGAKGKIDSTSVVIGLHQQEINAEINPSNAAAATGGGLIGALIEVALDSASAKRAEAAVSPVRNALLDYDFGSQFETVLANELAGLPWLNAESVRTLYGFGPDEQAEAIRGANSEIVVVIDTLYSLSPDLDALKITTRVNAYPKDAELVEIAEKEYPNQDPPLLYRNAFTYSHELDLSTSSKEQAAEIWASDGGARIRAALAKGMLVMAGMIALDLDISRAPQNDKNLKLDEGRSETYNGVKGTLVSKDPDLVILRLPNGTLHAASNKQ